MPWPSCVFCSFLMMELATSWYDDMSDRCVAKGMNGVSVHITVSQVDTGNIVHKILGGLGDFMHLHYLSLDVTRSLDAR